MPPSVAQQASLCLDGAVPPEVIATVGRHPLLVGRDRGCDVVVLDPQISRHHLLVWFQEGAFNVRDCGSALGTRVGVRRLSPGEAVRARAGEAIVLAERASLSWVGSSGPAATAWSPQRLVVRDGRGWAIAAEPPGGPNPATETAAFASVGGTTVPGGSAWLTRDEGPDTVLTIAVDHGDPASARFDRPDGAMVSLRGESRVVLLYLLAIRRRSFERRECASSWVDDREIAVGLWGGPGKRRPAYEAEHAHRPRPRPAGGRRALPRADREETGGHTAGRRGRERRDPGARQRRSSDAPPSLSRAPAGEGAGGRHPPGDAPRRATARRA
jgi:hypothetical protein